MNTPPIHQLYQAGLGHHQDGRFSQAESCYQQLLAIAAISRQQRADVLHLLGVLCHQTGRSQEAITRIDAALAITPLNADFLNNYGLALRAAGEHERAIASYLQGLQITPGDVDLLTNLGNIYQERQDYEQAAHYYRQVLRTTPADVDIREALCQALQALGNRQQREGAYVMAAHCYQEAIRYQPQMAALHYNLGNAQRELGHAAQAAESYRNALLLSPQDADIHNNLGNVLREQGQLQEAIACYRQALKLDPRLYHAQVHLTHQKQHICDWHSETDLLNNGGTGQGLNADIDRIRDWVKTQSDAQVSPFAFLSMPGTTAAEQRTCADHWLENRYRGLFGNAGLHSTGDATQAGDPGSVLRIGYLSADFRLHPLASLISELIELHDRSSFHVSAYSYGHDDASQARKRLEQAFDRFVDIRAMTTAEAAHRMRADGIDILVDLTGFTQGSRSSIAALRPAALNVSWLGFPGTMGSLFEGSLMDSIDESLTGTPVDENRMEAKQGVPQPLFDYLIGDATVTPLLAADDYAEKLALLPDCYQPNDRQRPVGRTPTRSECGLPEDAFVFCCFNQTFKLTPNVFDVWMRLLQAVPGSVLWLLECNPQAKINLAHEAQQRGVPAERLVFAPRTEMAEHLARQSLADLFLDTLPYNAHTTASDALWMGLPVLTCGGDTFASRVAASLLQAAGMPELITSSLTDYEATALQLATRPALLDGLRHRLQSTRDTMPLFDTPRFARNLETAYRQMWQRRQDGLPAESFQLS